jgi:murein DD-endopeptidase MepM/ murein hydrolase activator NlpD
MRKTFLSTTALALAAYVLLPLPGLSAPLSQRIQKKRSQIEHVKRREGVLTTTISGYNNRIDRLQGEIRGTQQRLGRVQGELDRKRNELEEVRNDLERARDRLERLRRELRTARRVLAARLVEIYKSDTPDALTVVLEADGFADLLERADFLDRISDQDRGVTDRVRVLRDEAQVETDRLAGLERRVRIVATQILRRRDEIAAARDQLVSSQGSLRSARGERSAALASVREHRHGLEEDLEAMERQQGRIQAQLAGAGQQLAAGPIKRGSGRFIWPVNGPITGVFGEARPGHMHAGIDIAAPSGTPIRAADSGRVVLMAFTGGYGNYTCVQHTASLSSCYAHQSRFGTSSGASVRQGQVIGYVGNTGSSTGAHLHFEARVGGSPVNPLGYL